MSYVMFLVTQILGGVILYFTYRGVFDLLTAFITVILMVGLQFHVMVRKPDGTSIRMACFTSALWMAALLSGRLFLEFRGWRSEERRVGTEFVGTCRSRWSPDH